MRTSLQTLILATLLLFFVSLTHGQVGIGTSSPDASARLQIDANASTNAKGFLPPRVTSAERGNITTPAPGLLVYQTDGIAGFYYYNGSAWVRLIVPTDNAANVTGTVAVANGGTGLTSLGHGLIPFGYGTSAFGSSGDLKWNVPAASLGIGVSTPGADFGAKLDVQGNASFRINSDSRALIIDGGDGSGNFARIYTNAVNGNTPTDLVLGTYNHSTQSHYNQVFLQQLNGFVGIRNSNPATELDVNGAVTATSIASPSITGGSGTSQTLTYKTTTGVGTLGADHIFQVGNNGGTEAMRITNGGKIGIGTASPSTALHIENSNSIGSGDPGNNSVPGIYVYNNNNSSSTAHSIVSIRTNASTGGKPYISFDANGHAGYSIGLNNPTDQLIINTDWNFNTGTASKNAIIINETGQSRVIIPSSSGNYSSDWIGGWGGGLSTYDINCASVYASGYVTRSDKRLKNSIKSLDESVFSKYFKLRPVTYYWNEGRSSDTKLQYGLIAQEVEKIFPEMVNTATDSMHTKSVNYQALHALSIKVIQSQQAEIDLLQKKHAELEIRLQKLESKLK